MSDVRDEVREHYRDAALKVLGQQAGGCCDDGCCGGGAEATGSSFYGIEDRADLPDAAVLASLGCGNPTAVAELRAGEAVLDLGSGGGIDVILSAKRVGAGGKAYGLDMTDEMLDLARQNSVEAGVTNVEFLKGYIEEVPLPDASVDVVISNCVINLAADKSKVFAEMHRVLREGGRIGVADIVAADHLTPEERADRGSYAGCIAGALSFAEYHAGLQAAGFEAIKIDPTNEGPDGIFAAIVRARRGSVVPAV
jgi:arsenite methyltransferase